MAFDIDVTGKAVLIVLILLIGGFLALFAPSLIAIVGIFVLLGLIGYVLWLVGVRINRRLTGRSGGRYGR